jgi:branched-chain amino acid transport system permease protein
LATQIVLGLSSAALYSLFASGLTLLFGVLDILNMAHGAVFMWSAFVGWELSVKRGLPLALAVTLAILGAGALGVLLEFLIFRPLRKRNAPGLMVLVAGIAVGVLLVNAAESRYGPDLYSYPQVDALSGVVHIGSISAPRSSFVLIGVAAVILVALRFFVVNTRTGAALRAIEENAAVAELMGIPVSRLIAVTFFIASVLAGVAGVAVGLIYSAISPYMGNSLMVTAFTIIILGGMGSIPGAILGSIAVAGVETAAVQFDFSLYSPLLTSVLVLVILVIRPQGILGRTLREA